MHFLRGRLIYKRGENITLTSSLLVDYSTTPIINEENEKQPSKIQRVTSNEFDFNSFGTRSWKIASNLAISTKSNG